MSQAVVFFWASYISLSQKTLRNQCPRSVSHMLSFPDTLICIKQYAGSLIDFCPVTGNAEDARFRDCGAVFAA